MNTIEQIETKRGYHFSADILRNGDPIPAIGEWISVQGPVIPCKSGLHMSEHPYDALQYAPGCKLHLVEIRGDIQSHGCPVDKWVGRERRIIATIDATDILRAFARFCALQVAHLWDCPDIVRTYFETGDESIRASASIVADASARATWLASARAASAARASAMAASARATWLASARAASAARASAMAASARATWAARAASAAWASADDSALSAMADASAMDSLLEKFQSLVDEAFNQELSK